MAKLRSLTERLDIALSFTETVIEKQEVFALLFAVSKRALNTTAGEFYANLRQVQLEVGQYQGTPLNEEITKGNELAAMLYGKIKELHPDKSEKGNRGYGPGHERARREEFELIKEFHKRNNSQ